MNKITNTRYGQMLYNKNDYIIGKCLEDYGEFSQMEIDFLSKYIPKNGVCVDIGANIGTHALFFAQAVGPQGKVIAFEPQRIAFQTFCANIALNHHLNVFAYNMAVGASVSILQFPYLDYEKPNNFGMVSVTKNEGCPVQAVALDNVDFSSLDFIKIDVEGYEPEVIQGAIHTINKFQPVIYAEYHPNYHSQSLISLIKDLGYDIYLHKAPSFNPNNFKKNQTNWHGGYIETNLFCCPKNKTLALEDREILKTI